MSASAVSASSEPLACALSADDLKARLADIGALARRFLLAHEQAGRTLSLRYATSAGPELDRLVGLEQVCCSFLRFDRRIDGEAICLDITAPVEAGEFAPLLYSHFLGESPIASASCPNSCGCKSSGSAT